MDATNGGILGGVLLLVLVFFVIFFIHIKRAQRKKSRQKSISAPTVQEVAVIEPVPITNLNNFVWDNDAEYQTTVLENQNTQKENQKLNLTFRQEALIKEQSKIFHETYSKVLLEKQRTKEVQSVIEDQKKIYNEIKQNTANPETQRTKEEQRVIEEQNKIYNKIKQNTVDSIRRQFDQPSFDYASTSTQSTTANVNMFQPTITPHRPEYYKQPSYNPNYY